MDELNNNGFNGEDGTPYEKAGVNRLEKGFDSENGTPYEPAGGNPFGDNDFDNAEGSTQHQFGNFPKDEHFDNIGQYNTRPPEPPKQYNYGNVNSGNVQPQGKNYYEQNIHPENGQYVQPDNRQNYYQNNNMYGQQEQFSYRQPDVQQYSQPYGQPNNQPYGGGGYQYAAAGAYQPYVRESNGLAVVSLAIAIINLIIFRSFLSFITVPICLILAIICLKKKQRGKGLAITAIVISCISLILFSSMILLFVKIYPDMAYFVTNEEQITAEFEENGTIPEQFEKYDSPQFQKYWNMMGCKDFKEFFTMFMKVHTDHRGRYEWETSEEESSKPDAPITA